MSERLGIGAFARETGLSVSAVRFYGDRGLLGALAHLADQGDAVLLRARAEEVTLIRREEVTRIPARTGGPDVDVGLDPTFARDAVAAAVGPEVVLEVVDALRPVVFRSADDGTATTLLMPVALA